jgi:hypothetical protein|nr:MAG TPA: Protein of unknown function (DUF1515) [Caudoviricetes sp.]
MTWEILSALIVVVGTLISLGTVLAKLIRVLTRLDDTVKQLRADLDRQREETRESHKRIYDRLDDHESRIIELERSEHEQ